MTTPIRTSRPRRRPLGAPASPAACAPRRPGFYTCGPPVITITVHGTADGGRAAGALHEAWTRAHRGAPGDA